eukprot:9440425-Alexandrium_andersonii.AAC.1
MHVATTAATAGAGLVAGCLHAYRQLLAAAASSCSLAGVVFRMLSGAVGDEGAGRYIAGLRLHIGLPHTLPPSLWGHGVH